MCNKLLVSEIDICQIQESTNPTFQQYFYKNCNHCFKSVLCCPENLTSFPNNPFYCRFCIRNNIELNKTIYFTLRAIFGYLYVENYLFNLNKTKISLAYLSKSIEKHVEIGRNKGLAYDPQSYFWCINCEILDVNQIMVMVEDMLNLFDLPKWLQNYSHGNLIKKFQTPFFEYNQNPKNIIVNPTLEFVCDNKTDFLSTKNFLPNSFRYR